MQRLAQQVVQLSLQVVDVPQSPPAVQLAEVGRRLLQRVQGQAPLVCPEEEEEQRGVRRAVLPWGGVATASVTCLRSSLRPEAGQRHLAASRQQQRSAFIHHGSVGQDGLQRLLQEAQRLFRDSQHQLEGAEQYMYTHRYISISKYRVLYAFATSSCSS